LALAREALGEDDEVKRGVIHIRLLLSLACLTLASTLASCSAERCIPSTCDELSRVCGTTSDGCGGETNCGECTDGFACSDSGQCDKPCVPTTCQAQQKTCGFISDGCGKTLACGQCSGDNICTGANVCAARPDPCAAGAWDSAAKDLFQSSCKACHVWAGTHSGNSESVQPRAAAIKDRLTRTDVLRMPQAPATMSDADRSWLVRYAECGTLK